MLRIRICDWLKAQSTNRHGATLLLLVASMAYHAPVAESAEGRGQREGVILKAPVQKDSRLQGEYYDAYLSLLTKVATAELTPEAAYAEFVKKVQPLLEE